MITAIIGIGLIGGSFALSLRDNNISDTILGVDNSENNRKKALELGLVDRMVTIEEAIESADLIVISTPVDSIPILSVKILNKISKRQIVMDMGSMKGELSEVIALHPNRDRYVATHPMGNRT